MPLMLSILACVAALLALLAAWRAWCACRRLALEMVHLRDRLAAAEAHYEDAAEARAARAPDAGGADASLAPRISALESRLRTALVRAPSPAPPCEDEDECAQVRRELERQGYACVTVFEDGGRMLAEAVKDGVTVKGRVERDGDGGLSLRSVSTARAFP